MSRLASALVIFGLLAASCTVSGSFDEITTSESDELPSTVPGESAATTMPDGTSIVTEFEESTSCDPNADDSNLQVVTAFVTAYNNQDLDRLKLLSENLTIADLSGIPHLGEDDWDDVVAWSEAGWNVNDTFTLTSLTMYDTGSVFEVDRSNDVLRANGIESLHHMWKVHSSACQVSHMVLYLPFERLGAAECRYWSVFAEALAQGTTQPLNVPAECSN